MIVAFWSGLILAVGLILPLGVQNVFIFQQGAVQPRYSKALPAVLTASLCDTVLILGAVLGMSLLVLKLIWLKMVLMGIGIPFLLYMGWSTWTAVPSPKNEPDRRFTPKKQVMFAASVSLLNPHAVLDTVGVIGTNSLRFEGTEKAVFAVACILVSWLWFAGLAWAGRGMSQLDPSGKRMLAFNKLSSLLMWGTALYLGFTLWSSV